MKFVLVILTALTLLGSQVVISSPTVAARACCGNCGGKCCVKNTSTPLPAEPLAPAPANASVQSQFIFLATSLLLEIGSRDISPAAPAFTAPHFAAAQPLFQRHCVYLI